MSPDIFRQPTPKHILNCLEVHTGHWGCRAQTWLAMNEVRDRQTGTTHLGWSLSQLNCASISIWFVNCHRGPFMGPPDSCHSRNSISPRAAGVQAADTCYAAFSHAQEPIQVQHNQGQEQPTGHGLDQQQEDQLVLQAVHKASSSQEPVPRKLVLPQPPNNRTVPDW